MCSFNFCRVLKKQFIMQPILFKLIFRNWWRNKTFACISIVSLAIGLACTNMLISYVIYELGIESDNPNKECILYMAQDSPMESGTQIAYTNGPIPEELKSRYPEVEDYLRISSLFCNGITVGEELYEAPAILTADSSLLRFFPYQAVAGNLKEALSEPNKIALSESYARKLFGTRNPLGESLFISNPERSEKERFEIVAVVQERRQSLLKFDAVIRNVQPFHGGATMLLVNDAFDPHTFPQKLKEDHIPTLQNEIGQYYFYTLQESYFKDSRQLQEWNKCVNHNQKTLLYISFLSAWLVLLIACFNYVNLNFSRIFQQVKMIYIEKVAGSSAREIYGQLFADTFLTVLIAFFLSLLLTLDLLPYFNRLVSGRLSLAFFFSGQVFPVICGFILLLSIIPALYMSHKVIRLSHADYQMFYTGKHQRRVVALLTIAQFAISIGLLFATSVIYRQLDLIRNKGENFRNLYEIGDQLADQSNRLRLLADELQRNPSIEKMALQKGFMFTYAMRQIVRKHDDGSESYYSMRQFSGDTNYLELLQLPIRKGLPIEQAAKTYKKAVYVNEAFARLLVPEGENPVGKPVRLYDTDFGTMEKKEEMPTIIAGIVGDLYTTTLQQETHPCMTYIQTDPPFNSLLVRLKESEKAQSLGYLKQCWEKIYPDRPFKYLDLYAHYLSLDKRTLPLFRLLTMYALISLLLTASGLFGIILYATEQRTKEIGIRKINGASLVDIVWLLSRQYITWITVAFAIAIPVSWQLLSDWLSGFYYRIRISGFECLLAGLVILLLTLLIAGIHSYKIATRNPVKALRNE